MKPTRPNAKATPVKSYNGVIAVLLAVVAGWFAADSFLVFLGAMMLSICVIVFWAFSLAFCFLWFSFANRYMEPLKRPFRFFAFAILWLIVFCGCVCAKDSWRTKRVHDFVDLASRELDKSRHYPGELPPALASQKPASLTYEMNGSAYTFTYSSPLTFLDFDQFDSATHSWQRVHF